MSAPGFKIGDKVKGVSLKFDSTAGELTATYAPNRGTSEFQATLHVTDTKLLQRMEELCEGAAMASATWTLTTRRLRRYRLDSRLDWYLSLASVAHRR